jgi:hypothetical protein
MSTTVDSTTTANTTTNGHSKVQPIAEAYEIGWMFVQQYYTFLHKEPERLHNFYGKKSNLIHGYEGETVEPIQGQLVSP